MERSFMLSFAISAPQARRSRLYSVCLAQPQRHQAPLHTEPLPLPAQFATKAAISPGEDALLHVLVDGASRARLPLHAALIEAAVSKGKPITLRALGGDVTVYAEEHMPELATISATFKAGNRGLLNARRIDKISGVSLRVCQRRGDGSWGAVYQSKGGKRMNDVGGKLLSYGEDNGQDVALCLEAVLEGRRKDREAPRVEFSLAYLRSRHEGDKLALRYADGRRGGYCVLKTAEVAKAECSFVLDAYMYGRGGGRDDLGLVMVGGAAESLPKDGMKMQATDLAYVAGRERKSKGGRWLRGLVGMLRGVEARDVGLAVVQNVEAGAVGGLPRVGSADRRVA